MSDTKMVPEPVKAQAQSREHGQSDEGELPTESAMQFRIGGGVARAHNTQAYERKASDPLYRPLKVFAIDPSVSKLEGAVANLRVPFEPLDPGPVGALFDVRNEDIDDRYVRVDLDSPGVLIGGGREASPTDVCFHQQMVYAVCSNLYFTFKSALGREPTFNIAPDPVSGKARLKIFPHRNGLQNAYYSREEGALVFGHFETRPDEVAEGELPTGRVFTCLSHDIICHELTHALIDGLRPNFLRPTSPETLAFHEAFSDVVATFQKFSYQDVVQSVISQTRGKVDGNSVLTRFAQQFGRSALQRESLRTVLVADGLARFPRTNQELLDGWNSGKAFIYQLGSVLVKAVFRAFATVFERKIARSMRLATGGTGVLPPGELPVDLRDALVYEATMLASQFARMCIRALDYCPPADIRFGEFLRAVITADRDLVPDDPWAYREAWIDAFRQHGIFPQHVPTLSEDALVWRPPEEDLPEVAGLSYAELKFAGEPGRAANHQELERQAAILGNFICQSPERMRLFGIYPPSDGHGVPTIESIRSLRRIGPDGQVVFDLVAEVLQRQKVRLDGGEEIESIGGCTVILGPSARVRFILYKRSDQSEQLSALESMLRSDVGAQYWKKEGGLWVPSEDVLKELHKD